MKLTISGRAGSGKSTVAKMVAEKLRLKYYSIGDIQGEIAKKLGVDLLELGKLEEKNPKYDRLVDDFQNELGEKEDNFIVDSRLGFHFIPDSIKIFLDVTIDEASRRIFNHRRDDEKENTSLEKTRSNIIAREKSEIERYRKYYGIDHFDKNKYDFVVDTSEISAEEVVDKIVKFVEA